MGVIDKQPTLHCGLYLKVVAKKEKVTKEALQRLGFTTRQYLGGRSLQYQQIQAIVPTSPQGSRNRLIIFWPSVKAHCKEIMKPSNKLFVQPSPKNQNAFYFGLY